VYNNPNLKETHHRKNLKRYHSMHPKGLGILIKYDPKW